MSDTILGVIIGGTVTVLVSTIGAVVSWQAAKNARAAQHETQTASPYDKLADRVVYLEDQNLKLEDRVGSLEAQIEEQKVAEARSRASFRAKIHVLLTHIDQLTQYAEVLVDIIRANRIPMTMVPNFPSLPEGFTADSHD